MAYSTDFWIVSNEFDHFIQFLRIKNHPLQYNPLSNNCTKNERRKAAEEFQTHGAESPELCVHN